MHLGEFTPQFCWNDRRIRGLEEAGTLESVEVGDKLKCSSSAETKRPLKEFSVPGIF